MRKEPLDGKTLEKAWRETIGYKHASFSAIRQVQSTDFAVRLGLGWRSLTIQVPAKSFYQSIAWFREQYFEQAATMFYQAGVPRIGANLKTGDGEEKCPTQPQ